MKNKTHYTFSELDTLSNYISELFNAHITIEFTADLYCVNADFELAKISVFFRYKDIPIHKTAKTISNLISKEYCDMKAGGYEKQCRYYSL